LEIDIKKIHYSACNSEERLLRKVIALFKKLKPDLLTGWNISLFDIPYLTNRIVNVLGENEIYDMSPIKSVIERTITYANGSRIVSYLDFFVPILDYLDLYKKYTYTMRESYKLGYIADIEELGIGKVKFSEKNFWELYNENYQLFIEYNIQDVLITKKLEDKLQLIRLVLSITYKQLITINDIFGWVKIWDNIIYRKLKKKNKEVIPTSAGVKIDYPGAYVHPPKPGIYKWIVSYDLSSLYPNICIGGNLSPDTKVLRKDIPEEVYNEFIAPIKELKFYMKKDGSYIYVDPEGDSVDNKIKGCMLIDSSISDVNVFYNAVIEKITEGDYDFSILKEYNLSMTPNLQFWRRDGQGVIGGAMKEIYDERMKYREEMLRLKIEDQDESPEYVAMDLVQEGLKYLINKGYGAFANKYFRYFDVDVASGITTTGQLIIRFLMSKLVKRFPNYIELVYGDTDSIYISLNKLVKRLKELDKIPKDASDVGICKVIQRYCNENIYPFISEMLMVVQIF